MTVTTREKILTGTLIVVIIIAAAIVLLTTRKRITSAGRIKAIGIEVYTDANATVVLEHIDWGERRPGDLVGVTAYIKNTKNTDINLTLSTGNWTPLEAETYLFIDWNYTGQIITPLEVLPVQITLQVDPNVQDIEDFTVDITIAAEEVA